MGVRFPLGLPEKTRYTKPMKLLAYIKKLIKRNPQEKGVIHTPKSKHANSRENLEKALHAVEENFGRALERLGER